MQNGLQSPNRRAGTLSCIHSRKEYLLQQLPHHSLGDGLLRTKEPIDVCGRHRHFAGDVSNGCLLMTDPAIESNGGFYDPPAGVGYVGAVRDL